ncbi:MAG: penicillin-binding protein 1C [Treponema sp.]|nr:penicillin-binding protein 1C [Treponema sp.]
MISRTFRRRIGVSGLAVLALIFALSLPDPLVAPDYSPALYDREGRLLGAMAARDGQWRFPPSGKTPEKFAAALIEFEDRRFFYHPGVDPIALVRACVMNWKAGRVVSGGSTITMQTLRLIRRGRRRTLFEKGMEAILALRLEMGRSKEAILALYAANAPFGGNVVGLDAACWRWFGRSAQEFSWAEAALLAVLPNSPALINPGRNRDILRRKRDALLERLHRRSYFDGETLRLALQEELPEEPRPLPRLAPHLLARLVQKPAIPPGPIQTTLDLAVQERARAILNRASERFAAQGIMNGACLILDTPTGAPVAYVGNTRTPAAGDVDLITAPRSSGSLLKPVLFAAMLDSGDILPAALVSDIPTRVGSYSPENLSRSYQGAVPANEALARSLNIPAVRSLRRYGVDRFARLLRSLGLSTLFRPGDAYGLPLILGGAEVTLEEITGLYARLARTADPGRFGADGPGHISPGAAWLTLEALIDAVRPGEEAQWQDYAGSRRIAWKTGTSFGFRDAWAVGVTPRWTVGVWIGNATGEGRAELRSALTAAPVLFDLFSALDSFGSPGDPGGGWFSQPAEFLKSQEVCAFSGFPPGPDCRSLRISLAPRSAPPHRPCPFCRTVLVDEQGQYRVVLESGEGKPVREKQWFVLPPAEEWYYRKRHLDYKPLPPWSRDVLAGGRPAGEASSAALALFNPNPGSQVYIPRELDGGEGRIVFSAAHRDPRALIYWHLDDAYLGKTGVFHELEARPGPGRHTLTLVDRMGNTISRAFEVLEKPGP